MNFQFDRKKMKRILLLVFIYITGDTILLYSSILILFLGTIAMSSIDQNIFDRLRSR